MSKSLKRAKDKRHKTERNNRGVLQKADCSDCRIDRRCGTATRAADKEENGPASNDSSPPEYDVASVNLQNLISEKVRHNVPSLISRKVLGLDMYAESKILKNKTEENDDDDSFFD